MKQIETKQDRLQHGQFEPLSDALFFNWPIPRPSPPGGDLALEPRLYADTRRKWQSPLFSRIADHRSVNAEHLRKGPMKRTHLLSLGFSFPSIATRKSLPVALLVVQETLPGPTRVLALPALGISRVLFFEEERFPPRCRAVPSRLRERAQQCGSDGDRGHAGELLRFRDGE